MPPDHLWWITLYKFDLTNYSLKYDTVFHMEALPRGAWFFSRGCISLNRAEHKNTMGPVDLSPFPSDTYPRCNSCTWWHYQRYPQYLVGYDITWHVDDLMQYILPLLACWFYLIFFVILFYIFCYYWTLIFVLTVFLVTLLVTTITHNCYSEWPYHIFIHIVRYICFPNKFRIASNVRNQSPWTCENQFQELNRIDSVIILNCFHS